MSSTAIWLETDDPNASYREPLDYIIGLWRGYAPGDIVDRLVAALEPTTVDSVVVDPVRDGSVVSVDLPGPALGLIDPGFVRLDIGFYSLIDPPVSADSSPSMRGRAIVFAAHSIPTSEGADISDAILFVRLVAADGATLVERDGWSWAFQLPNMPWIIGRPYDPIVVHGLSGADAVAPHDDDALAHWNQRQRQRLMNALQQEAP